MWVLTTRGFYSVVADRDDPDTVVVRARREDDLRALDDLIPGLAVVRTPDGDYGWRAFVSRDAWASAATALAREIDYDNFKNAVGRRQSPRRAALYHEVWHILSTLQRS